MFQQLRYKGPETKVVNWKGTSPLFTVTFTPVGDKLIPDDLAQRLLTNPKYEGQFEVLGSFNPVEVEEKPKEKFKCDQCEFETTSKAALGSHKRKHKEISNEQAA